mmetsp:Transcript_15664/g.46218  ORF Transcript_15664/g.46218 Transcript_15664/m.46218 type:complete len:200 (+) Transcript_15664:1693-2292(+)
MARMCALQYVQLPSAMFFLAKRSQPSMAQRLHVLRACTPCSDMCPLQYANTPSALVLACLVQPSCKQIRRRACFSSTRGRCSTQNWRMPLAPYSAGCMHPALWHTSSLLRKISVSLMAPVVASSGGCGGEWRSERARAGSRTRNDELPLLPATACGAPLLCAAPAPPLPSRCSGIRSANAIFAPSGRKDVGAPGALLRC